MQKNGHVLFISVTSYSQSLPKCPCEWNTTGPKPDCIIILGKQSYNDNCKIQIKHTILKPAVQFTVTQIRLLFSFLTHISSSRCSCKESCSVPAFPYYPWSQTIPYCPQSDYSILPMESDYSILSTVRLFHTTHGVRLFHTTHGVRLFHTVHSQTIAYYPWSQTIPYYPWNQTIPYCPI